MIISTIFDRSIRWIVAKNDLEMLSLPGLPGWALLNPLARLTPQPPMIFEVSESELFVVTDRIALAFPEAERSLSRERSSQFLKWVRVKSGQVTVGVDELASMVLDREPPTLWPAMANEPPAGIKGKARVLGRQLETAIRFTDMLAPVGYEVAACATLLLDAIHAFGASDYQKTILYAAIAVEVMTNSMLEQAAIESVDTGMQSDPIYRKLRKDARRDFSVLLHELPWYVLRRSLLIHDKGLYDQLLTVHRTRNELVHQGESRSHHLLAIDHQGAASALSAARAAFAWYGMGGSYVW